MHIRRDISAPLFALTFAAFAALLPACSKEEQPAAAPAAPAKPAGPSIPVAPANGQSTPANAIASHLEFGGEIYAIVDTKGDLENIGNSIADFLGPVMSTGMAAQGMPPVSDWHPIFKELGLYTIDGAGVSSWKDASGPLYHYRMFLYTPSGRTGLLKVYGGNPAPFVTPDLASADTDVAVEMTLDLKSLYDLIINIAKEVAGPDAVKVITDNLNQPLVPGSTLTGQNIVDRLNTRLIFLAKADPTKTLEIMPGQKFPKTEVLIALDGFADLIDQLQPLLAGTPQAKFDTKNGMKTVTLDMPLPDPFTDYSPMLIGDPKTKRLYLVSSSAYADQTIFAQGARLSSSSDYKAAMDGLPSQGNVLSYVSKNGASVLQQLNKLELSSLPKETADKLNALMWKDAGNLTHGVAGIETNLPDGMLAEGATFQSPKTSMFVGPIIAVMAGLSDSVSQVDGLHASSSGNLGVTDNLRQIANSAQLYMLDKNVTEVSYQQLTSGANPYLKPVTAVSGESYDNIVVRQGSTRISVTTSDGTVVSYDL